MKDRLPPQETPDGRYIIVRGRLWRRSNPNLSEEDRQRLVKALMSARREVNDAAGDMERLRLARQKVDDAKIALGERGAAWWTDGTPDYNRHLLKNTPYAN